MYIYIYIYIDMYIYIYTCLLYYWLRALLSKVDLVLWKISAFVPLSAITHSEALYENICTRKLGLAPIIFSFLGIS